MRMKSCEGEMLTGWGMGYDMELLRIPQRLTLKPEMDESIQIRREQFTWVKCISGCRACLILQYFVGRCCTEQRTANTERYLVFCILVNSFFTYNW